MLCVLVTGWYSGDQSVSSLSAWIVLLSNGTATPLQVWPNRRHPQSALLSFPEISIARARPWSMPSQRHPSAQSR
jgi:hypothetical protein